MRGAMHRYSKALLAALTVTLLVGFASQTAIALRSINVGGERNLRAEGLLTFGDRALERMTRIICRVVFKMTVGNSIPKRRGAIFGKVTNVEIEVERETCRHGEFIRSVESIRALRMSFGRLETNSACRPNGVAYLECNTTGGGEELWNLVYESILGTLPNIEGILLQIEKAQIKIESRDVLGIQNTCLYEGNIFMLYVVDEADQLGLIRILLSLSALRVRRLSGTCPEGKVGGELNPNTLTTVTLV